MKKLIKKNGWKDINQICNDLTNTYSQMLNNKGKFYFITITETNSAHSKDLNFVLKNKLFNTMWKDYKNSFELINYLYVIEYPGAISKNYSNWREAQAELEALKSCEVHCHIIVNSLNINEQVFEFYIHNTFKTPDVKIIDITNNPRRGELINYLKKQKFLTDENYNYKITLTN